MEQVTFDSEYLTGHDDIDKQHKFLVTFINSTIKEVSEGKNIDINTLDKLIHFAKLHFNTEEELMIVINYPDLKEQETEHLALLENLEIFRNRLKENKVSSQSILMFLRNWFNNHTKTTDYKLAKYLKSITKETK